MTDILLDIATDDVRIENGDFVIGESLDQEVGILLRLSPGELKEDPVLGPGLYKLIKSNADEADLQQLAKWHLARDGKQYDALKERIKLNV